MPFAAGVATQLRLSKESTWGTAPAAGTGRLVRRKTCDLAVVKEAFESGELLPHYQRADARHGLVSSSGALMAEPSPGAHSDLIAASLRKDFAAGVNSGALTTVTAAATPPHFIRGSGSWITAGFKVGDIIRWTGWASGATANNARNYIITALTATDMTVADLGSANATVAAKAAGDSVTATVHGKKSWIPGTGHTDDSFSIERMYVDVSQSELFLGVKVGGFSLKFAPGAMADLSIKLMGAGYTNAASEYFTTPTAVSTTSVLAGPNGGLLVAGSAAAYVRELSLDVDNGLAPVPVIGSNAIQGITQGVVKVAGSLTAYFKDAVMRDYFLNETEVSLIFYGTTSSSSGADFIQLCLPRVKLMSNSKPDGPGVIAMQLGFQGLYNGAGGASANSEATTLSIQDSLAA